MAMFKKESIITIICAAMSASTYAGATSSLNLSYTAPEVEINEASTNQNDELQLPKKNIEWSESPKKQSYVEKRIDPVTGDVTYEKHHFVISK